MDFTARKRKSFKPNVDLLNTQYSNNLNMYDVPPIGEISLEEFENLALERVQLLRTLEYASLKGHKPYSEEWKQSIKEELCKYELKKFMRLYSGSEGQSEADINARKADHLSHYILRLAYCRSEELRRWFMVRELEWFKLRFMIQTQNSINKFLELNKLIYIPISEESKNEIYNDLLMSTANMYDVNMKTTNFFKVPFTEVGMLLKTRRVYVKSGFAYIPTNELVVCVQAKFRTSLSEALSVANQRLPSLDDDRLNMLLVRLTHSNANKDYNKNDSEKLIDPADLDQLSMKHFPLCMRHVHETLRASHHLKHNSRLQYGLFLKGIGLTLEDAIEFWREEFTKIMDINKFEKSYLYNIKHGYGKSGGMVNYTPFSCIKIIKNSVGPGDHHGCPFKHWESSMLKQKMMEYGISSEGIECIVELAKNSHFQIACTRYFEYTHASQLPSMTINHPNQYFEDSTAWEAKKKTKAEV